MSAESPAMSVPAAKILELLDVYEPDPAEFQWLDEADRWAELVFCILNQFHDDDSEASRAAVGQLQYLGLIDIDALASTDPDDEQRVAFITHVLRRHGFDDEAASIGVEQVRGAARFFVLDRNTKVQQYMRHHAEQIRDDLVAGIPLAVEGCDDRVRRAVVHWLQNAYNLPISLQSPVVDEYSRRSGFSMDEAIQAADDIGLTIAALDDLLEAEAVVAGDSLNSPTEEDR